MGESYERAVDHLAALWGTVPMYEYGIAFHTIFRVLDVEPTRLALSVMRRRRVA